MSNANAQVLLMASLLMLSSCASQPETAKKDTEPAAHHPRAREMDLVTPDASEDLTKIDDATLSARIAAAEKRSYAMTAKAAEYMTAYTGDDLSKDGSYRALLRDMKAAETEFGRLEMERARRVRKSPK